jgi:hypothetical protein
VIGAGILVIFLVAAVLMFLRKLPAILALPLMAAAIAALEWGCGKLTLDEIGYAIFADGSLRLAEPIVITMFGGMVSLLMQKAGVAEKFIRVGAELAGDDPWTVAVVTLALIAILFTTIGGLGAVIMVGTIVLPILASLGLRDYVTGAIVLFGISLGGTVNPNNWAMFTSVLKLDIAVVSGFALEMFVVVALASIAFISIELWLAGRFRLGRGSLARAAGWLLGISALAVMAKCVLGIVGGSLAWECARVAVGFILAFSLCAGLADGMNARRERAPKVRWHAYLIPLVPLALILLFQVPFVPAFLCGFVYGIVSTLRRGSLNMTSRAIIEGSQSVIPAVVLMVGIGMLLNAILGPSKSGPAKRWYDMPAVVSAQPPANATATPGPTLVNPEPPAQREWPVSKDMEPLLAFAVPRTAIHFVLIFSLLAPLALYRGPLNVWGLGYGVGTVLISMGVPSGAVMGILMSVGIVQGVSDPTNTQNVWIANEVRVDVNTLMWRTILFTWCAAIVGLVLAGARFYLSGGAL